MPGWLAEDFYKVTTSTLGNRAELPERGREAKRGKERQGAREKQKDTGRGREGQREILTRDGVSGQ